MWASSSLNVTHESYQYVDHFAQLCFEGGNDFMQIMEMKWNKNSHWKLGESVSGSRVVYKDFIYMCIYYLFSYAVCFITFRVYWLNPEVFCSVLRFLVTSFSCVIFTWCNRVKLKNMSVILQGWWRDWTPLCALRILSMCSIVRLSYICQLWHFLKNISIKKKKKTSNKCLVFI